MIIEACNRTLKATHQPSFEYADSILTKWNKANVKTPEDIRKSDAEYELLRNQKKHPMQLLLPARITTVFTIFTSVIPTLTA